MSYQPQPSSFINVWCEQDQKWVAQAFEDCTANTSTDWASTGDSPHFKGVRWDKGHKKRRAQIYKDGQQVFLGRFDDVEEAARKYDEASATIERPLNFPTDGEASAVKKPRWDIRQSVFKGVTWDKASQKWVTQVQKDGKRAYLGHFDDEEEAAREYDEAAWEKCRP